MVLIIPNLSFFSVWGNMQRKEIYVVYYFTETSTCNFNIVASKMVCCEKLCERQELNQARLWAKAVSSRLRMEIC